MNIVNCITALAHLGGRATKNDGFITERVLGQDGNPVEQPVIIDGLKAVVPTQFQISGTVDPLWKERVIFNPLSENVVADVPTSAFRCMLDGLQFRLNVTLRVLVGEVLRLAASTEAQKDITAKQMEFISQLEGIDEQTAKFFNETILSRTAKLPEYLFVKLFPKHLGTIGETQYNRVTHVSFPLYEGLTGDRKFGAATALPKGSSLKLASVIRAILADVETADWYSAGSNSRVAPFAESAICAFIKLANDIRRVQLVFPDLWEGLDEPERFGVYDVRAIEPLRNCDALLDDIRQVPAASGTRSNSSASVNPADVAAAMPRNEPPPRAQSSGRDDRYESRRPERDSRFDDRRRDRDDYYDNRRDGRSSSTGGGGRTLSYSDLMNLTNKFNDDGGRGGRYVDRRRDDRYDDYYDNRRRR